MDRQSAKWEHLALGYISDAICVIYTFIVKALERVCPDARVRRNMLFAVMDNLIERHRTAQGMVVHLLHIERNGRFMMIPHWDSVHASYGLDNCGGNIINEAHDIIYRHYAAASQRFAGNICIQAMDYHLVSGPSAALKLVGPSFIDGLTQVQLEHIAGEQVAVKQMREQLKPGDRGIGGGKGDSGVGVSVMTLDVHRRARI